MGTLSRSFWLESRLLLGEGVRLGGKDLDAKLGVKICEAQENLQAKLVEGATSMQNLLGATLGGKNCWTHALKARLSLGPVSRKPWREDLLEARLGGKTCWTKDLEARLAGLKTCRTQDL